MAKLSNTNINGTLTTNSITLNDSSCAVVGHMHDEIYLKNKEFSTVTPVENVSINLSGQTCVWKRGPIINLDLTNMKYATMFIIRAEYSHDKVPISLYTYNSSHYRLEAQDIESTLYIIEKAFGITENTSDKEYQFVKLSFLAEAPSGWVSLYGYIKNNLRLQDVNNHGFIVVYRGY